MPAPMPVGGLTMASFAFTAAVIGNAYYQKRQFYPSVVYITKSNPSMAAIYLLAFTLVILLGKLLKKVFFGSLRAAEFEHLVERSFYAVTETCLAFTVFRDDFSPKFVALFTVLLFLKAFHWLADYRVDFMERSPVITLLFHTRVSSLLLLLSLLDLVLVNHAYHSTITRGASVQLVFGFEYAILLTVAFNIAVKYICHTVDLQSQNPWENKAMYLLYTELIMGFFKVVLYLVFLLIMIRIHTFPLFIIRPMYLTMRSFKRALNDVVLSRRAISNMNTLYPDATPEELTAVDNVCIICREEMLTGAKKLPCGHIFHASCLRSWFQRQQTCPTCRMDILRQPPQTPAPPPPQPQPQPQPQAQPPPPQPQPQGQQQIPNPFERLFGGFHMPMGPMQVGVPPFPFPAAPGQQPQPQPATSSATAGSATTTPAAAAGGSGSNTSSSNNNTSASTTTTTTTSSSSSSNSTTSSSSSFTATTTNQPGAGMPAPPLGMMPPFFPFIPFNIPPPRPPPNFSAMTEEEVRRMEGSERQHVEARVRVLRNIQTLLDAAVVQMNQYASVVASLDMATSDSSTTRTSPLNTEQTQSTQSGTEAAQAAAPMPPATTEPIPSTSGHKHTAPQAEGMAGSSKTSEKPQSSSPPSQQVAEEDDQQEEIRRRRLERFS